MKSSSIKRKMGRLTYSACALAFAGGMLVSCEDTLLTGVPSWLGSSIYDELVERGEFKTTLKFIDDPVFGTDNGEPLMRRTLRLTGSKTLFVAKDEAYDRFFQNNKWGVTKYEDLTDAQKLLLFNSSMVNSAYLIELLSNISGDGSDGLPRKGLCLRRATNVSLYDSIPVLKTVDMPKNVYWDRYRERNRDMLIVRDNTTVPMSHFLPAFLAQNQITADDLSFLTNGACNSTSESYVNAQKVIDQDVTCQNGYIQVVENVMIPLTSMAEVLRSNPEKFSIISGFLDRFAVPVYDKSVSDTYNRINNTEDSVFVWRYLNNGFDSNRTGDNSTGNNSLNKVDGVKVAEWKDLLPYDPGWNAYENALSRLSMQEDMAVIIAPTDEALNAYFNAPDGGGKVLKDNFGEWENVKDNIIAKLLQNLMKESVIATVPSKFGSVINTAQQEMNLQPEDFAACHMASNGVIFEAKKVYTVPEYQSVAFPTLLEDNMRVMDWIISATNYDKYLNSMAESKYTFVIPTDKALANYVDPVDYHKAQKTVSEFYYDDELKTVKCKRYKAKLEDGKWVKDETQEIANPWTDNLTEDTYIKNRLKDVLDNCIVLGNVETSGYTYYSTKGGGVIKFIKKNEGAEMAGPFQIENQEVLSVREQDGRYDMSADGNGVSYILDDKPVMPASKSVPTVLKELIDEGNSEYAEFYNMLMHSSIVSDLYDLVSSTGTGSTAKTVSNDTTITVMNNYNYTVYVPTSEEIKKMYEHRILPNWEEVLEMSANPPADVDKDVWDALIKQKQDSIDDFLRYHIQNKALYLGGYIDSKSYETALMPKVLNDKGELVPGGRFTSLGIKEEGNSMTITCNDIAGSPIMAGQERRVISGEGQQRLSREYRFRKSDNGSCTTETANYIYNSSFAVVHLIDKPLLYSEDLFNQYNKISGN